jgi:hypothetical protein
MSRLGHGSAALLFCAVMFLYLPATHAVIIRSGDGSGNTTAPPDDPGWANVGLRGGGTGVYLGNQWVLTANHVGAGTITLGATVYNPIPGSAVQLSNPPSYTPLTDLLMFRIDTDPGLPPLTISSAAPLPGAELLMIGRGRNRQANLTHWDATWNEVGPPGVHRGFKWAAGRTARWGENHVAAAGVAAQVGGLDVLGMLTTFDEVSTLAHEAQAATGDSGGAVFHKNGANWELAGTIIAVTNLSGQPASTAVFNNTTFSADLSVYRQQILTLVAIPEPGSLVLALVGAAVLAVCRRRRSR